MEAKFSELKFELKDVSELKNAQWSCELEINDDKFCAGYKTQIKLQCLEIVPNTVLSISLMKGDKFVGSLQISFATLFGEGLQGKTERWFRLKSQEYPKVQIKVFAALNLPEKSLKRVQSFASSCRSKESRVQCPYLEGLRENQEMSALDEIWKQRGNGENSIKFSIEPDSPGIPSQAPKIEEISLEKLQKLGGLQLKHLIKDLCEEIKQLENISLRLPQVKEELEARIVERRNAEKQSQNELEKIKEKWMQDRLFGLELLEKRKKAKISLMEKQESLRRLEAEFDILQAFMLDLKREKFLITVQNLQYEDCEKSKLDLESLLVKSQKNKQQLEERLKKTEADTKIQSMKTTEEIHELRLENHRIQENLKNVNYEYNNAKATNEELKSKLNSIRSKLEDPESLKKSLELSQTALKTQEHSRDTLNTTIDSFIKDLDSESKSLLSKHNLLISKKSSLSSTLLNLNKSLESSENEVLNTQKSIFDHKAQKISNEQICCVRADLFQLHNDLQKIQEFYSKSQQQILPDLLNSSQILSEECRKVLNKSELLDSMIEMIDKKEEELEGLKSDMGKVQKRQVFHVPVKGDAVDEALAQFVNAREVPVRFVRQEGGNYLFGTCKVYIKLENSKLLAKVRGGFMGIDEFVDVQTEVEYQRGLSPVGGLAGVVKLGRGLSPENLSKKVKGVLDSISKSPKKQ